jgi:hypothetical protein
MVRISVLLSRLNQGIKPSKPLVSWAIDEFSALDKAKTDISAIAVVLSRANQKLEISKSLIDEAIAQYEVYSGLVNVDIVFEDAEKRHHIVVDRNDPMVRGLVAYTLHRGYAQGWKERKEFGHDNKSV